MQCDGRKEWGCVVTAPTRATAANRRDERAEQRKISEVLQVLEIRGRFSLFGTPEHSTPALCPPFSSMWDRRKRILLLWSPIIWIIGTTLWLRRLKKAQAVRVFEARERLLLQGEDVALNPVPPNDEENKFEHQDESSYGWASSEVMQPLLISIVSFSRALVIWLFVMNLISNEIGYLYCRGHTGTVFLPVSDLLGPISEDSQTDQLLFRSTQCFHGC